MAGGSAGPGHPFLCYLFERAGGPDRLRVVAALIAAASGSASRAPTPEREIREPVDRKSHGETDPRLIVDRRA